MVVVVKELDKDMPISECIGVACLPSSADKSGVECSITGWGTLMSSGNSEGGFRTFFSLEYAGVMVK